MFTDKTGDTWSTELDGFIYLRLKRELGVNVFDMFAQKDGLPQLMADLEKFINALWIICEEQAVERGVDEIGFAKRLGPKVLEPASKSFIDSVIDFLQTPEQRKAARRVYDSATEAGLKILETVAETFQLPESLRMNTGATPASTETDGSVKPSAP